MTGKLRPVTAGLPQWTKIFGEALTQRPPSIRRLVATHGGDAVGDRDYRLPKEVARPLLRRGDRRGARSHIRGRPRDPGHPARRRASTRRSCSARTTASFTMSRSRLPVIFALDRAGMVGEDGQTHMGLYAHPLPPGRAAHDGHRAQGRTELIGLLRCALEHKDGPFSVRYPRDKAPAAAHPKRPSRALMARGAAPGRQRLRLAAVGVMCQGGVEAAELLAAEGLSVSVVNCRFLKPLDRVMLEALVRDHRLLAETVEDGSVVTGSALRSRLVQTTAPEVRRARRPRPDRACVTRGAARRSRAHRPRHRRPHPHPGGRGVVAHS